MWIGADSLIRSMFDVHVSHSEWTIPEQAVQSSSITGKISACLDIVVYVALVKIFADYIL